MNQYTILQHLAPAPLWRHFAAIADFPRCSKHEERIRTYIEDFAKAHDLAYRIDTAGNIVVKRPSTSSGKARTSICLQGHLDMICEKNLGTAHDFSRDPIRLKLEGDWLSAEGTTLGADNGIAVAMMLAVLESSEELGPIECLFTVDEETGLTGALDLDPDLIESRMLINLDSEEEGFICIGCAGGRNSYGTLPLVWEHTPTEGMRAVQIKVFGLQGGHSGAEIHKGLGNSLVIGARLLERLFRIDGLRLASIWGGDKHNAIPREFTADILVPDGREEKLQDAVTEILATCRTELGDIEPGLDITVTPVEIPVRVMAAASAGAAIALLVALPHGVLGMSRDVDGLVETSTNLAAVRIEGGNLEVLTSQRSSRASLIDRAANQVGTIMRLAGGTARHAEGYPAWTPNPAGALLQTVVSVYQNWTGKEPEVGAFHAGLECGVIGAKVDGMDMVSFGPDLQGVHTPQERMDVSSAGRVYELLLNVLKAL